MILWILLGALVCLNVYPSAWQKAISGRERSFWKAQLVRYVIGLVVSFVLIYLLLIDWTWSGFLSSFGYVFALNLIITPFVKLGEVKEEDAAEMSQKIAHKLHKRGIDGFLNTFGFMLLAGLLFMHLVFPLTQAKELAQLGGIEPSDKQIESVTDEAVRSVPYSYARYKSEIVFGNIDNYSYYDLGESSIQKIDDELYWVSPIEYASIWRWWSADSSPGYIMVSAEDPNAEAQLVSDYDMKYIPSAYFGENLERHVRQKYKDVILIGKSFEPDDDGKPYYAYSYARYELFRSGPKAEGVILVDAVTGEMQDYALGEQPAFVDNAMHSSIALDYAKWYGKYRNGFWNSMFAKKGVHEPTSEDEMIGVLGSDGELYWMIDHMRPNQDSNTMVGFSMVNTSTGEFVYYTGSAGLLNARGAQEVVNKSFQREQWIGQQPVLYSVYDNYTWVVPVVDGNGLMREIALVHAESGKIASGKSRKEAFNRYRQMLAQELGQDDYLPSDVLEEETIEGEVYRMSQTFNNTLKQMLIRGEQRVIEVDVSKVPEAVFIQEGDTVRVKAIDTAENVLSVTELTNVTVEGEFGQVEDFAVPEDDETTSEGEVPAEEEATEPAQ
ncbi:hypothetical protein G4V62_06525 [Bacillaceae bacterium SIJ1]|uniref:hypothetical protein n=1 Tax=Litoribacterium kuwaitense TaxID=1398745 RepID=UPI0013EA936C|nr:hypothetical protein [Litoribacterium kuwaitense]NGP44626.1 hypothetical protein [Litoribacterium kuwaitense]